MDNYTIISSHKEDQQVLSISSTKYRNLCIRVFSKHTPIICKRQEM